MSKTEETRTILATTSCTNVTTTATEKHINPSSVNFTKWSNTLKQLVDNLPTNFLSVFRHFVGLALKG